MATVNITAYPAKIIEEFRTKSGNYPRVKIQYDDGAIADLLPIKEFIGRLQAGERVLVFAEVSADPAGHRSLSPHDDANVYCAYSRQINRMVADWRPASRVRVAGGPYVSIDAAIDKLLGEIREGSRR